VVVCIEQVRVYTQRGRHLVVPHEPAQLGPYPRRNGHARVGAADIVELRFRRQRGRRLPRRAGRPVGLPHADTAHVATATEGRGTAYT